MACLLCLGFWPFTRSPTVPANAWFAQDLMHRTWVGANGAGSKAAPWPWADTLAVARLTARRADTDLIVLTGGDRRTLTFAPIHMSSSALPGQVGNAVIAGHHTTHFRFLQETELGELLDVEDRDGRKHRYKVIAIDIVDAQKGSLVLDTATAILSLVTSYPFESSQSDGRLRFVVTAMLLS